jgi:hypothetical protein
MRPAAAAGAALAAGTITFVHMGLLGGSYNIRG